MKSKPIVPRELANRDVDAAIQHYLDQEAASAARGFIEALEQAYVHIGRRAATGSPRYAHELNLPGLRFWPLTRYPYLVFYVEQESTLTCGVSCMVSATYLRGCNSRNRFERIARLHARAAKV